MGKKPFVTEKVASGHMIQRGGEKHDGEWVTGIKDGVVSWSKYVFDALFWPKKKDAEEVLVMLGLG